MQGALIIDKPAGITSHDAVNRVRRIVGERRVGHTGTLDPFATGVVVMLIGKATRLMQFLSGAEKEYEALIRLGYATDSGDCTGRPLQSEAQLETKEFNTQEIEAAMAALSGDIQQIPPMYSAKKIKGRKLYELARRGEEVEREPVPISIKTFAPILPPRDLLKTNDDGTRDVAARIVCSAGTYVRTLAEDFGKRLGVGAHLAALRRTRAGNFSIAESHTLEELATMAQSGSIADALISMDATIAHLPAVDLNDDDVHRVSHGVDIQSNSNWEQGQHVRLRNRKGELIAVAVYDQPAKTLHTKVMLG